MVFDEEDFNKRAHNQVRQTATHQDSLPATAPEATAAGNIVGITTGQISHTIVPPMKAAKVINKIAATTIPNPVKRLFIFMC